MQINPARFLPGLALSLNNHSVWLRELGRPEDALTMIEEAIRWQRDLARENPERFLPDLARSVNNLSGWLGELSRQPDAEALFDDIFTDHDHDPHATGLLLFTRASWRYAEGDLGSAIADAWGAIGLLDGNARRRAQARLLMRSMKADDAESFDLAWSEHAKVEQPVWLRYHRPDPALASTLMSWVARG